MSEMIVKLNADRVKLKGCEYVRDLIRCEKCKHWCMGDYVYGICYRCPNTRQMRYDDFCSYGCIREGE